MRSSKHQLSHTSQANELLDTSWINWYAIQSSWDLISQEAYRKRSLLLTRKKIQWLPSFERSLNSHCKKYERMPNRHNRKWSTTAERSMMQTLAVSEGHEVYGGRRLWVKSRSSHKAHISNIPVITSNDLSLTVKFAVFFHRLLLSSRHFWPFLCSNHVREGGERGSSLAHSGRGRKEKMDDKLEINRKEEEERKKGEEKKDGKA